MRHRPLTLVGALVLCTFQVGCSQTKNIRLSRTQVLKSKLICGPKVRIVRGYSHKVSGYPISLTPSGQKRYRYPDFENMPRPKKVRLTRPRKLWASKKWTSANLVVEVPDSTSIRMGRWVGVGLGLMAGGALGAGFGSIGASESCETGCEAQEKRMLIGLSVGLVVGLVGGIMAGGAMGVGSEDDYRLDDK